MAGHAVQLAQKVRAALESQAGLREAVDALYAELGTITTAKVVDTGAGGALLVCLPGYGPLREPTEYVHIAERV